MTLTHNNDSDPVVYITIDDEDGTINVDYTTPDGYVLLGHAPVPRNQRETFIHHLCHGLLMRYPVWKVVSWSWTHRNSFEDES